MMKILVFLLLVTIAHVVNGLGVRIIAQPDDVMASAVSNQCGLSRTTNWDTLKKKCPRNSLKDLNEKEFYRIMDEVKSNSVQLLSAVMHSSNLSPNGKLNFWPKIHFPVKRPDGSFNYIAVDREKVKKTFIGLKDKEFFMFMAGCSGDRRSAALKEELLNVKANLGVPVVKKNDAGKYVYYSSEFSKDPMAFSWNSMLKAQDHLLLLKPDRNFFSATLKEVGTYYALMKLWEEGDDPKKKGLLPKGFVMVHNIAGSLTYPTLSTLTKNLVRDMAKAKHLYDIAPHIRNIVENFKLNHGKYSNYFTATVPHKLQRTIETLRFCRNGHVRRNERTRKFYVYATIRKCLGKKKQTYMEYMDCCVGEHLITNKETINKGRYERRKLRGRKPQGATSSSTTSSTL